MAIRNPITPIKKTTKKERSKRSVPMKLKEYYGITYFDTYHMTQPIAEALAEDLFNEVCINDVLTLEQFCKVRGIPLDKLYAWMKKFKCIDRAVTSSLPFIGDNREIGALKKRLPERMVMRTMSMYNQRWKENDEWWAKLSKTERDKLEEYIFELRDLTTKKTEATEKDKDEKET